MPTLPPSGTTLTQCDRLIALLTVDSVANFVSLPIRGFPPSVVSAEDQVVAALWVPDLDDAPGATTRHRLEQRGLLHVMVYCGENDDPAPVYRRLVDVTDAFKEALWKFRAGPLTAPRDWHSLRFGVNPTTQFKNKTGSYLESVTQLHLTVEKRNP